MLGASAVQLGTDVRDAHRAALAEADDACTVVTDVISGRPCRYICNKLIDDLVASGLKPLPVPAQQSLTVRLSETPSLGQNYGCSAGHPMNSLQPNIILLLPPWYRFARATERRLRKSNTTCNNS